MSTIAPDPARFAALLKRAIAQIHAKEGIAKGIVEDELGYAAGRQGSTAIHYWCRGGGHIPDETKVALLAQAIADRKGLDEIDLLAFVRSAGYPAILKPQPPEAQVIASPEPHPIQQPQDLEPQPLPQGHSPPLCGNSTSNPHRSSNRFWAIGLIGLLLTGFAAIAITLWPRASTSENGVPPGQAVSLKTVAGKAVRISTAGGEISSGGAVSVNELFTVSFTLINSGIEPVNLTTLVISARGPSVSCSEPPEQRWRKGGDHPLKPALGVRLQVNEEFEYVASRSLIEPGHYFLEATLENPKGQWHGITPFTCIDLVVR